MRVLRLTSGLWKPAMRMGEPVRSYWRFPFEIDNPKPEEVKGKTEVKKIKMVTEDSSTEERLMTATAKQEVASPIINKDDTIYNDTIYKDVDSSAQNITVKDGLENTKVIKFNMPRTAMELGISGKIVIQFVIEKNGTVSNVIPVGPKEKQLGYGLEEECMRVVKLSSGQWKPSIKGGIPVRSYMRFPFDIDNSGGY